MTRIVVQLLAALLLVRCAPVRPAPMSNTELGTNERCAIESAEAFIEKNGYTTRKLTVEEWKAVAKEGIDTDDVAELARLRHDTLKPRAYGLIANPSGSWVVVFEPTRPRRRNYGRGVEVEHDCKAVRVVHSNYALSEARKIPRP